jgi:hypothetical protein
MSQYITTNAERFFAPEDTRICVVGSDDLLAKAFGLPVFHRNQTP